jgi:ABC-type nitrate/sulfonate/bicarbonate transport system permease component
MNSQQHGAVAVSETVMPACEQATAKNRVIRSVGKVMGSAPQIGSLLVGVVAWEILGWALDFPFLPPFSRVIVAWWELFQEGKLVGNLLASLTAMVIGFSLAAAVGLTVGTFMGLSEKVENLLDIYVNAFLASPSITYVPVFYIFFGISNVTRVAVVFWYAFWIIIVNTCTAIRCVDADLVEMARSFGANRRQLVWKVMLPDALPLIMAGFRLGVGRAVKGMINGEMFIALVGLGAMVRYYGGAFDVEHLLAVILNILVVALIAAAFVQAVDRRLTRWQPTEA